MSQSIGRCGCVGVRLHTLLILSHHSPQEAQPEELSVHEHWCQVQGAEQLHVFMQFLPEFLRLHITCHFFVAAVYSRNGCLYLYLVNMLALCITKTRYQLPEFCVIFYYKWCWHKQAITFPIVDYRLSFMPISVLEQSHTMLVINIIKLILMY
jgi:hypothetical protein